jgi:uncharacterized protein (DUF1330 family)
MSAYVSFPSMQAARACALSERQAALPHRARGSAGTMYLVEGTEAPFEPEQ